MQLRKTLRALLFVAPLGPAPSVAETPLADLFDTCLEVVESRSETPALSYDLLPLNQGTWHARVETPLGPVSLSISKEDGEAGEVLSCDVTGADTRGPIRSWRPDITWSEALDEIIQWGAEKLGRGDYGGIWRNTPGLPLARMRCEDGMATEQLGAWVAPTFDGSPPAEAPFQFAAWAVPPGLRMPCPFTVEEN